MLVGCTGGAAVTTTDSTTTWEVASITDGDTIGVVGTTGEITLRLLGINAPERGECFAIEATRYLESNLRGATITVETGGNDQFGRTLAHVFLDDRHVNLELVAMGLAIATTPDGDDDRGKSILAAEETAFAGGTGLWSATACGGTGSTSAVAIDGSASKFDPPGPDDEDLAGETVVIVNMGSEHVDMTGWTLRDESSRHRYTFAGGSGLGTGESLTVDSAASGWEPGGGPVWSNGGDMALLLDSEGTVVSRWRY